ncbi:MAG: serine hydrolase [Eubacteriales bacterium]|nr:serine hydrolase [Eubacteriales bacterium]
MINVPVSAAKEKSTVVKLVDGTGRYLEKAGGAWYLRNSAGKKISGLQYIKLASSMSSEKISTGYYYFDGKGCLTRKSRVIYVKNRRIHNRTFNGYYYISGTGRLLYGDIGIRKLNVTVNNKEFNGIYYIGEFGKISTGNSVHYIYKASAGGKTFQNGYFYFQKGVLLTTPKIIYNMNLKSYDGGKTFKGNYYFGDKNGRLVAKTGWYTVKNEKYHFNKSGKMSVNCWKDGYYLLGDGKIARSMAVPGSYVDCDGRRCQRDEYVLSAYKKQLQAKIQSYGGQWGIYIKNLSTGDIIGINENVPMYPASTIKAFMMAATYEKIKQGAISDASYAEQQIVPMIYYSDNTSYNTLVEMYGSSGTFADGSAAFNGYLKKNGYTSTASHHTLHPANTISQSDGSGQYNTASAKDGALLMERIYRGTCVSQKYSEIMLDKLLNQSHKEFIPYLLPSGVRVADKPGWTDTIFNDIAIVYGPKTHYIISIYTEDVPGGILAVRDISSSVYHYFNG